VRSILTVFHLLYK